MSLLNLGVLAAGAESGGLPLLLSLAILILAAKLVGELAARLGQPAVLGELLAGLLLGPTLLDLLFFPVVSSEGLGDLVHLLGQVGVVWLMFAAGLETELDDLRDDLQLFASIRKVLEGEERHSRLMFTVVPDDFDVDKLIEPPSACSARSPGQTRGYSSWFRSRGLWVFSPTGEAGRKPGAHREDPAATATPIHWERVL
ncbi:MAG: cation:proton antiporter [Chloroflexota bacterium]